MKKNTPIYILIITNFIIILLLGYMVLNTLIGDDTTDVYSQKPTNTSSISKKEYSAEEIINSMKEKSTNIGKIVVFSSDNDPNNLLGRPNQYTSKIQFEDVRIDQSYLNENEVKGGTIEVFSSKKDMENRKSYIESISSQSSLFAQYIYSKGYAILRLECDITPEQAKEYEELFYQIVK